MPLRAYLESWLIVAYTENLEYAYPGYLRATPESLNPGAAATLRLPLPQQKIREFRGTVSPGEQVAGNEDLHILRVEPAEQGFRAFVCDATFRVYTHRPQSAAFTPLRDTAVTHSGNADAPNMAVWRIEFKQAAAEGDSPPAAAGPQSGSSPAPLDDVFGPWSVTGSESVAFWWEVDHPGVARDSPEATRFRAEARETEDQMRQVCLDRYPMNAAEREKLATTVIDNPPPVEPATPGWPNRE
ncbi:hypothetical protein ACRCUN_17170 [Mycobacterium sp. LTG2003]